MTTRVTRGAHPERLVWLSEHLGGATFASDVRGIEVVAGDVTLAQAAVDQWMPNSARLSLAAEGVGAARTICREVLWYIHDFAGKGVIRLEIPSHSTRAQRLAELYGFKETARITDGYAIGDALVLYERRR